MTARDFSYLLVVILVSVIVTVVQCECNNTTDADVKMFLKKFNDRVKIILPIYRKAAWAFNTNVTDVNQQLMLKAGNTFSEEIATEANNGSHFDVKDVCDNDTRRDLEYTLSYRHTATETKEVQEIKGKISQIEANMEGIYSKARVCLGQTSKCLLLEPGLTRLLVSSTDSAELSAAWKGWRDASGKKMKKSYVEFVKLNADLLKERKSSYADTGEMWRSRFGNPDDFEKNIKSLLKQIMPLYQQVHAFVKRRLETIYKDPWLRGKSLIPAHLLGNMWAQDWSTLASKLMPFPDKEAIDITDALKEQNYTATKMFHLAEDFFKSLNLIKMTDEFWNNSMIVKPTDGRDVVCHASAWDFGDGKDFRIKMCTDVNQEDLITIHHEMGHIEYDLQYKNLPFIYHDAANSGFHEAVGDTLALSVQTIKHLKTIGLLDKGLKEDSETDINYLMSIALQRIVFLPFAYVIDRWRWDVFKGDVKPSTYNQHWWDLRCKYQGIVPPVERSEDDFDPGAKYHVAANVPYIRYFVSHILQFQFYEALCNATNHTGPLYKCDFYNNTVAGDKLSEMLSLGSSKPWPEALETLTGSREMDIGPLMRYFEPLIRYMKSVNGEFLDWEDECPKPSTTEETYPPTSSPPTTRPGQPQTTTRPGQPQTTTRPGQPQTTTPGAATSWGPGVVGLTIGVILSFFVIHV